jgi:hypothetical protein
MSTTCRLSAPNPSSLIFFEDLSELKIKNLGPVDKLLGMEITKLEDGSYELA